MINNSFTEAFPQVHKTVLRNVIKYACQKQIFCDFTQAILDMRTCILIDVETADGKTIFTKAVSPSIVDKLGQVKENILRQNNTHVVKFYSSNKKAFKGNELITLT